MDQGLDKTKPASTSYRETFRRHRKLLCMPIILGAIAAAVFLFGMGRTYKSAASLWVDTTPPVPSSVGINTGAPLSQPPAVAEQAILNELLSTRAFTASVAKSLGSVDASREKAGGLPGNGQLLTTVPGNQVLQISYSDSSPATTKRVLDAVIAQLRSYTGRLNAQHDRATVAYDREQVKVALAAVTTARSNVAAYQAKHPNVSHTDSNYVSLVAAENDAVTQLSQANAALNQMTASPDDWSVQVVDPPSPGITTPLRKSKMATVILGGALGGLLVSFLAVVALTPSRKEVWEDELPIGGLMEDELPIGGPLFPDVPPADPFQAGSPGVPTTTADSALAGTAAGQPRLSLGNRRFSFRTPSAHTEEQ